MCAIIILCLQEYKYNSSSKKNEHDIDESEAEEIIPKRIVLFPGIVFIFQDFVFKGELKSFIVPNFRYSFSELNEIHLKPDYKIDCNYRKTGNEKL
ncbi:unnamed protein product [marine sediment metagenome]|uniref:Uncharacterized protein n=1 Tax=marine sediment metagenome TaxID=412755 RepID=X0WST3_9ZZZZ